MSSYKLPQRADIEKLARQVYEALTARQPKPGEAPRQYRMRVEQAKVQYREQADALSQMLLGPVADQLANRRLLIVAEGALQYVPFGALPKPKTEGERGKANGQEEGQGSRVKGQGPGGEEYTQPLTPLIVDHEIVNLPSASVMAVLRRETQQRKAATKAVAVLADPVFEADDPRLTGDTGTGRRGDAAIGQNANSLNPDAPAAPRVSASPRPSVSMFPRPRVPASPRPLTELQRALRDVSVSRDGLTVPRLLSTRQEADAILSVTPDGEGWKAVGFDASRATAMSPELGQYRIVHFATHGLMNNEHPELSGLVLSLVDEQGRPQDGFLRLHDIYNLNLPADLVVLSACNTGLGKDVRGEGLVGIVRGFMYAGAARVVASLWKVDDEATAELMKRFYRHMLQAKLPPAAALRAAQVGMWQQKQWQSPYYWAGFVLQGEWK